MEDKCSSAALCIADPEAASALQAQPGEHWGDRWQCKKLCVCIRADFCLSSTCLGQQDNNCTTQCKW